MINKIPVTKFKESKAFKISKKIKPKDKEAEMEIFFRKIFKVNIKDKYKGVKKEIS